MYYFYMVRCCDNSLYCGSTNNVERRVKEHNFGAKSAKYTKSRRPVVLVYSEEYEKINLALKREWQVKKWPKIKKEFLIINL